jgi:hypothetical protein
MEFKKIKNDQGGLLLFNNFLSTSTTREVSLGFTHCAFYNPDLTAVLFQIDIDPSILTTRFHSLDDLSYFFYSKKEILDFYACNFSY